MLRLFLFLIGSAFLLIGMVGFQAGNPIGNKVAEVKKPNIVFIFADDLGYGDLGCYGAQGIKTPNIDKIAANGLKFTQFYVASPVCSPSRAGLLTGRYPVRQGINGVFFPDSFTGIANAEITLPEVLKKQGYSSGIVGKWHLGHLHEHLPLQNGFDSYFGIPYSNDMNSVVYMRDNKLAEVKVDQRYITQRYTQEALKFIDKNKSQPFFLYLAHNMPHIPIYASEKFIGSSGKGLYGDVIQELDWSVGEVMNKLKELNLEENTIVVFTSDNGPWLVKSPDAGSAGNLREGKQTTFEGGMRVPAVVSWKGRIKPGRVVNEMATMMDWFPTFIKLAGGEIPQDRPIDGDDIGPVLFNTGKRQGQDLAYFYNGKLEAFRSGDWKIKLPYPGNKASKGTKEIAAHGTLLFNLSQNPDEKEDLAATQPAKLKEMEAKLAAFQKKLGPLPAGLVMRAEADNSLSTERAPK